MKSKYIIISILFISLVISMLNVISVNKKNKNLLNTINVLKNRISLVESENNSMKENMKPENLAYIEYKYNYRFIGSEINMYQSPKKEFSKIDLIPANTAVQVEDAVQIDNDEIWLYIKLPQGYDSFNIKGWIREKESMPITKENQQKIIHKIIVKEGSKVYYMAEFEEIKDMEPRVLDENLSGSITERKDGYANITCIGGLQFWVEEKYITYPPIEK